MGFDPDYIYKAVAFIPHLVEGEGENAVYASQEDQEMILTVNRLTGESYRHMLTSAHF